MEIISGPISSCSKEHQKIYQEWFNYADADGDGRITGNDATKFFALSNLSRPELKQVWAISDSKRQGFLGFKEFIAAMQLVTLAQAGHEITEGLLSSTVDLENLEPPVMENLDALLAKKRSPKKIEPELSSKKFMLYHCALFPFLNSILNEANCYGAVTTQPQSSVPANWFTSKSVKKIPLSSVTSIVDGLKRLYIEKLKPLEVAYRFNDFVSPTLANSDFDSKPMVMLLGQYSTGKTTFIKHLLRTSYPGAHIGPEPTTDRFVVVMSGPDERSIPGNTIAVQADMPFSGLTTFGSAFLSKFQCSQMPHQLMRVYGALMWSLGKVLNTPEVMRVYIGSFNDKPVNEAVVGPIGKELFEKEQDDLLSDLKDIPKKACDRRINEFVKRARAAKIHAYIMSHLKKEMPSMMGKAKAQQRLVDNLEDEFAKVQREYHLPLGDFPSVDHFREVLSGYSIDKFEKLKPKMVQAVDDMLGYDIPELLKNFRNPYE
ncbi:hypothetical protein IFM89_026312 [Coptis chinensis]|uniref:EH domain-containing protein 1 n=1 Tax=Coptis chinensis TaxID=261450 RepID=A0A835M521_9MAGN|nr:hypothetical protein IFM89_026312 [Coptis chinensis]